MLKKQCLLMFPTAGACHTGQGNVPRLADAPEEAAEKARCHQQYHITRFHMTSAVLNGVFWHILYCISVKTSMHNIK